MAGTRIIKVSKERMKKNKNDEIKQRIDQCDDFSTINTNETAGSMEGSPNKAVSVVMVVMKPLDEIGWCKRHLAYHRLGLRSFVEKLKAGDQHMKEEKTTRYDRTPILTEYDEAVHGPKTIRTWVYEYRDDLINAKRSYFIVVKGRCVTVYFGRIGGTHRKLQYMRYTCAQAETLSSLLCVKRTKRKYVLISTHEFELEPTKVNDGASLLETIQEDGDVEEQKGMEVVGEEEEKEEEEMEEDCIDAMLDVFNESSDEEEGGVSSDEEEDDEY
jgi:predicted DNA-binding WGR domain protein